jgi:uncharacterized membrane protein
MNKILNRIVWLIVLVPGIYLAFIWNKLPDIIAMHFDIKGNADRYGNKKELLVPVIILTVISLFVYFLFTNIYRLDPKKYAAENKGRLQRIGFAVAVFMAAMNCMIVYTSVNRGSRFDISLVLGGVGFLFAIIGNYMPNRSQTILQVFVYHGHWKTQITGKRRMPLRVNYGLLAVYCWP